MVGTSDILQGLDDEQRAVAEAVDGPVLVIAGAGTGKTTAITHRIAYATATGQHEALRTMAVTFTNRAAGQMRARLGELGVSDVQVRTFHSAALRQLRHFWPKVAPNRHLPRLAANPQRIYEEAAQRAALRMSDTHIRHVREGVEALRMQRVSVAVATEAQAAMVAADVDPQDFIRLWRAYDELKTEGAVMDFTDVLAVTVGMFTVHPELLREVHRAYRWFTVDEYQDVSPLQWDLLEKWRGESSEICVVGDANQTIYTFAGASANYLLDFGSQFPEVHRVVLTRCYRCTPEIVAAANSVMVHASTFIELRSQRAAGPEPTISSHADDRAEVHSVVEEIAAAVDGGVDPRDIAILVRTNAQAAPYAAALADRGVPVVTRGVDRFFQRPEVKEAMLRLRAATGHEPMSSVTDTLSAMTSSSADSIATLRALADDFAASVNEAGGDATVADFVAHLNQRAQQEHAPTPFGVTLATLHAAKGLEWAWVFLVGWSDGLMPLEGADVDEERRLAYVGLTRARDRLAISWGQRRTPHDSMRAVSRFLTGAGDMAHTPSGPGPLPRAKPQRRTAPATCRICGRALASGRERTLLRCARCPAPADQGLVERLHRWRAERALARGVREFQVLTDTAIEAIAELRPEQLEGLLDIPGTRWLGDDALALLDLVRGIESRDPRIQD